MIRENLAVAENVSGNIYDAVRYFNEHVLRYHSQAKLVTIDSDGRNSTLVWTYQSQRFELPEEKS